MSIEPSYPTPISFTIHTEVAPSYLSDLLVFIYQECVLPYYSHFTNVGKWVAEGKEVLTFTLNDTKGAWQIVVEISATNPIEVKLSPYGNLPPKLLDRLREDLIISIQMFEEKVRRNTLYFAWVPENRVIPEKVDDTRRKVIRQIFMGNMIFFFLISIVLSFAAFIIITEVLDLPIIYFPFIMVLFQFIIILFSDKIIGSMGDWSITRSNPNVYILQYHIPPEQIELFRDKNIRDKLMQIKRSIQNRTFALGRTVDIQIAQEAFSEYGINIKPENIVIKTLNVYSIVERAAARFKMSVPKIRLSNVIIPNAAATGPSPRFGLVLITTGLLVQLDEDEIFSVIGHEMSHVKNRDPMALFILTSTEYILRIYFWPYIYFFGFFYLLFALGIIYFIAKFFEARADLDSAVAIGQPEFLANALRKIGYRKIQLERMHSNITESWLGWNPHPPISFRVDRLESLEEPQNIKHTFIKSIKDCINGLLDELRRI
ncbi:MAG: M48 family metalloprotease [Candidatus Bathyarchaeia archaeon]